MSPKRPPSKQRRQTQNQRQRAAREARRANAAARASDLGADEPRSAATTARGSLLSRLRGAAGGSAPRAGTTTRATATSGQPVGHRAAMSALLAAAAAAAVGGFFIRLPLDRSGDAISGRGDLVAEWSLSALDEVRAEPDASAAEVAEAVDDWTPGGEEPYAQALWPFSLGALLPVAGAFLAFRAVSKRAPAKVVNRTMYVTLFGTLLAAQLLILFIPAVVGVAIAAFQVRKAEVAGQVAAAGAEPAGAASDDVIEVEEAVEDDAFLDAEAEADADGDAKDAGRADG